MKAFRMFDYLEEKWIRLCTVVAFYNILRRWFDVDTRHSISRKVPFLNRFTDVIAQMGNFFEGFGV